MTSHRLSLIVAALALALAACGSAPVQQASAPQGPAASRTEPAEQPGRGAALDAYLERTVPFGFSGAFLVARAGDVLVHGGYGLADRENTIAMTPETVFDIGSITKQFTAAAILKLEEQGRLRVQDSIGRFLPNVPADKQGITLHHLLTHTSGLVGDLGGDYQVMPRDSVIRGALASELQWAPGSRYDYSNLGYSLLGAIVELTSGVTYERYLNDHLLTPAGMRKTGYRIPRWSTEELAVGYRDGRRWGTPLDHAWAPDGPWWNLRANGGILSTMGDLYRWHRALEGDAVLSAASRAKMFTPHVAENAEGTFHYGYGWAITRTPRDTRLIMHNGGNGYFFADFLRYVDDGVVIMLATNDASGSVNAVRQRVIDAVFSDSAPSLPPRALVELATAELEPYAGTYMLPSGARIAVTLADGRLHADAIGQGAAELLANTAESEVIAHRELSVRADSILAGAARGDFSALHAASPNPERSEATLQRIWRSSEQNQGAFRSYDVLGTVQSWWGEEIAPVTFVRLDLERGSRLFRLHWENGRISGYGGMAIPNPARTTLLPQGEHRFIGYNLGIEHPISVRFELPAAGAATTMVLTTPGGELRATRRPD